MNFYPAFESGDMNHLVKITLQDKAYKGCFFLGVYGKRGNAALDFDIERFDIEEIAKWQTENCTIQCAPNDPTLLLVTLSGEGDIKTFELDNEQFEQMIVSKEIIKCTKFDPM